MHLNLDVPVTDEILHTESAWAGGVADFGDRDAGYVIQTLPGYGDYRGVLEDLLREQLGEKFVMYRAMTQEGFSDWQNGADMGPIGFTLSEDFARAWQNFAPMEGKGLVIVRTWVRPEWVIMRGKPEEDELVVDADQISFHTLETL